MSYSSIQNNMDIIFFFYGLAFFVMSTVIFATTPRESRFEIARIIGLAAMFGLIHGVNEWFDMWAIIKGSSDIFDHLRLFALSVSFLILFEFGRRLFIVSGRQHISTYIPIWIAPLIWAAVSVSCHPLPECHIHGGIWMRYLLGFPASILTGLGLLSYYRFEREGLSSLGVRGYFLGASFAFFVYGFLSGLVVPAGDFFPSNLLNDKTFLSATGVPVQVFRAGCAMIVAWCVMGLLKTFSAETEMNLKKALDVSSADLRESIAKLQAANRELSAISYNVSHELRSPIRAVSSFSSILLEDHSWGLDAEGKRLVNIIKDSAGKMGQLVDGLVEYLRMGRKEMTHAEIDMRGLMEEVMEEFKPAASGRNIRTEVKDLPPSLGDKGMVRQALYNLLCNAFKFTRSREVAVIEVGCWTAEGGFKNGFNVYYVKDNGVGFDMRYENMLFNVFQRLHGMEEFEGAGVGLAIVKRIIERHGGRVWAEGKVNEGATFYFTLPKV